MHTQSQLSKESDCKKPQKDTYLGPRINKNYWNITALFLMIATVFWHLVALSGWFNGKTLVTFFGMDQTFATAIAKCPNILFYATHLAMGASAILLIITFIALYNFFYNIWEAPQALNVSLICVIISIWAFPLLHVIADLVATMARVRDTTGFDVFQLGIDTTPMLITTVICAVILWLNKRIDSMI